jgi:hypothetical protein
MPSPPEVHLVVWPHCCVEAALENRLGWCRSYLKMRASKPSIEGRGQTQE